EVRAFPPLRLGPKGLVPLPFILNFPFLRETSQKRQGAPSFAPAGLFPLQTSNSDSEIELRFGNRVRPRNQLLCKNRRRPLGSLTVACGVHPTSVAVSRKALVTWASG